MKSRNLLYIVFVLFITGNISSCKKTLDLDYDTSSDKIVVEGLVSNAEIKVRLTHMVGMRDTLDTLAVQGATVTITGSDGYEEQLELDSTGWYVSPTYAIGQPGVTYTLRVAKGDTVCTATSIIHQPVELDSVKLSWLPIMSDINIRLCKLYLNDDQNEESYYQYLIYRNGEQFHSSLSDDMGMTGEADVITTGLMSQNESEEAEKDKKNGKELEDDIMYEGDKMTVELRTLDYAAYNYLRSMSTNTSSAINPSSNLNGKYCLGYFSTFYASKKVIKYSNDNYKNK